MKISDIVNQLRGVLPKYTDYFSTVISVSDITSVGGIATLVTTTPHNLTDGFNIVLRDVVTETPINSVSQDGILFTFTTAADHDLTLGWPEHEYINLSGFTDPNWNSSFRLIRVPNRRTFCVQSTDPIPVLNSSEVLEEVRADGVNGRYSVTVIDPTTIGISGGFMDGNFHGGKISVAQRISGAVHEQRALEQYTEQGLSDLWMFVVMSNASVSKDRHTFSDATSTKTTGTDMRLRLIDGFSLFLFKNTSDDITAIEAIDIFRHDLLTPILRSVNGIRFPTGLARHGDFRCIFTGHNFFEYNRAVTIYQYDFEVVMDLTGDDTVAPQDTMAFRDIDYSLLSYLGSSDTEDMNVTPVNLDEEPL